MKMSCTTDTYTISACIRQASGTAADTQGCAARVRIGRAGAGPQRTIVEKIRSGASIIIGHAAWRLLILRSCSCLSVQYSLRTEDCGPKNVLFYKKNPKKMPKKINCVWAQRVRGGSERRRVGGADFPEALFESYLARAGRGAICQASAATTRWTCALCAATCPCSYCSCAVRCWCWRRTCWGRFSPTAASLCCSVCCRTLTRCASGAMP